MHDAMRRGTAYHEVGHAIVAQEVDCRVIELRIEKTERPQLKALYAQTDNFWAALRLRFAGLKTQLLAGVSMAATGIVALHDFILTNAFGIDWTPVRDLLPPWAWPFILFADFWLISKFRQMTDRRQEEGLRYVDLARELPRRSPHQRADLGLQGQARGGQQRGRPGR